MEKITWKERGLPTKNTEIRTRCEPWLRIRLQCYSDMRRRKPSEILREAVELFLDSEQRRLKIDLEDTAKCALQLPIAGPTEMVIPQPGQNKFAASEEISETKASKIKPGATVAPSSRPAKASKAPGK